MARKIKTEGKIILAEDLIALFKQSVNIRKL
jgi:hypothetical protein